MRPHDGRGVRDGVENGSRREILSHKVRAWKRPAGRAIWAARRPVTLPTLCGETRSTAKRNAVSEVCAPLGETSGRRTRLGRFLDTTLNAPTPPRRFVAPQGAVARSAPLLAEKAASSVSVAQVGQAAAATTLLAALPANAFSAAYLPAILVPVMCLVMPVLGMGLFTLLTQKEEI